MSQSGNSPARRWALSALVVGGVVILTTAFRAPQTSQPTPAPNPSGQQTMASARAQAEFDQLFIDMMVPHHQATVAMARIALDQAEHAELKAIAATIIETQTVDIDQMKEWRLAWYGSAETPPMSRAPILEEVEGGVAAAGTLDLVQEIERLRTPSGSFDRTFLDTLMAHELSGMDVAHLGDQHARRPEIQGLAAFLVSDYQRELRSIGVWRLAWYGPDVSDIPREFPFGITPGMR